MVECRRATERMKEPMKFRTTQLCPPISVGKNQELCRHNILWVNSKAWKLDQKINWRVKYTWQSENTIGKAQQQGKLETFQMSSQGHRGEASGEETGRGDMSLPFFRGAMGNGNGQPWQHAQVPRTYRLYLCKSHLPEQSLTWQPLPFLVTEHCVIPT